MTLIFVNKQCLFQPRVVSSFLRSNMDYLRDCHGFMVPLLSVNNLQI